MRLRYDPVRSRQNHDIGKNHAGDSLERWEFSKEDVETPCGMCLALSHPFPVTWNPAVGPTALPGLFEQKPIMQRLKSRVAIVTGASRGAGRGIALVLGEEGATVYVTGRSIRGAQTNEALPGTSIEDTAELVSTRGGVGIPVRCDHTVDSDVGALFEQVRQQQERLDLLVNNVWGGYENYETADFDAPFWEQPIWRWDRMFNAGVRAHYVAGRLAAPIMMAQRHGLIVNTTFWDRGEYLGNLPYDLAKTAINRMAHGMALELRPYHVSALALSPGWMRTEAVMAHGHAPEELNRTESVEYIGRAVAALAADANVLEKSGRTLTVGDLARGYGFADVDGSRPPAFRISHGQD
jgi:NAD(P)-dependent dehydrogenase (short-subunit alcohol dehydrogenase family)